MKKTLLGFTIVLLLMISELLILNNDIVALKASNTELEEDLKDKKDISTLKEEKEDLNTSVSDLLAVSTFSDEDIEEIMTSEKTISKDLEDNITSLEKTIIDLEDKLSSLQKEYYKLVKENAEKIVSISQMYPLSISILTIQPVVNQ